MRMIFCLMICLFSCVPSSADDALVLKLPFDGSPGRSAGASEIAFGEGKIGQAVHVKYYSPKKAGSLWYDVSRLIEPRKGTLAFWVKSASDFGPADPIGRLVDIRSEEEAYYHVWMRISVKGKGDFTFQFFDTDAKGHGFDYTDGLKTWKANEWHHLAVVWHCLNGVRVYDNGREVFSSWGKDKWEPLTPTHLAFGCIAGRRAQSELWFDEARLFTEPLTAAQVATLAQGKEVAVEKKLEKFPGILSGSPAEKLNSEVSDQKGMPVITLGKPVIIRQHLIKSAKVLKVTRGEFYDGRFHRRRAVPGAADIKLNRRATITHLALDGPNVSSVLGKHVLPAGKHTRSALKPPLVADRIRLDENQGGPSLNEIRFYQVTDSWTGRKGEQVAIGETFLERAEVQSQPVEADTAYSGVSLQLRLVPPYPRLARIDLTEETERDRRLFSVDARVEGKGDLSVTLDWPDYIVRKGGRVTAGMVFYPPCRIADGSSMWLHATTIEVARAEYVQQQLGWFAPWYSRHAEAHRWDSRGWQPSTMPELRWLANARHFDPENPLATAYHNRIFHKTREVQVEIPGPEAAPLWARAQREAMRRTADVVHWWIDHRQSPDGQFGGGWNDDVEMLHGWDLLVLGAGDEKVKASMARLCDGIWASGRFTRGYSNIIWDVEHAAEDSTYSQPRMVPLEYGNPKWIERCMETISNFDFWTEVNPRGHRHFKSYMFQAQKIRPKPETDSDVPDNARAAKIGLSVVWYNGNERIRRWFTEWADAWVEDSFKQVPGKRPGCLPGEIVAKTCRIGREGSSWKTCKRYPLGGITYHMEDQLVGVYHFTGDKKYLGPIEAQIASGRAGEAAVVNWRRLTGSRKLDERFIGKAAGASPNPSFNAWLATGDKTWLQKALVRVVEDFERNRFLVTEAEPPTDRVPLPGNVLLRQMILGGIGVWVCGWPQMAVSWERTGYDFAALVLEARPAKLKVLAWNFGPAREVTMRVWELARGKYELKIGPDNNQDDALDSVRTDLTVEIDRATRLTIPLPANELTLIELNQVGALPAGSRPDLAVSSEDIELSADRRKVAVTVHNIGSAPSQPVRAVVYSDTKEELGTEKVEPIPPPNDLKPQTVRLTIALKKPAPKKWKLVIDPEGTLDEITRENNALSSN